jgi:hypothetical protein
MNTCPSSHGGGGYALGSYWKNGAIICGLCGYRIENPPPTGGRLVYRGWWDRLFGEGKWIPTWPNWIA